MGTHICDGGFTRGRSKHCDFFEQISKHWPRSLVVWGHLSICHLPTFEGSVILSPRLDGAGLVGKCLFFGDRALDNEQHPSF